MKLPQGILYLKIFPVLFSEGALDRRFEDSDRLDYGLNLDLLHELGLSTLEKPVFGGLFAAHTPALLGENPIDIKFQRAEEARVDFLKLTDVGALLHRFVKSEVQFIGESVKHRRYAAGLMLFIDVLLA